MVNINALPEDIYIIIKKSDLIDYAKYILNNSNKSEQVLSPKWMTTGQLSSYTSISRPQIYLMIGERKIPFTQKGRRYFFNRNVIDEWLKQDTNFNI